LALDGASAVAHEALALISTWTDWDWEAAERLICAVPGILGAAAARRSENGPSVT
jgi:hypothetical protein